MKHAQFLNNLNSGLYDKDYLKKLGVWQEKDSGDGDSKKNGKQKTKTDKTSKRTLTGMMN